MSLVDTHVPIYPGHDPAAVVRNGWVNLQRSIAPGAVPADEAIVLCLAERSDCHAFAELAGGRATIPGGIAVEAVDPLRAVRCRGPEGLDAWIVAGRQIRTRERLEVLALTVDEAFPDGLEMGEAVGRVRAAGGIPVLPWSPGKWTGRRGAVIRETIDQASPGEVLLADSSLRPRGWRGDGLLRRAASRGLGVVAGTDPLPLPGEEYVAGACGCAIDRPLRADEPAASLADALATLRGAARPIGRRRGACEVIWCLARMRWGRRR